MKPAATAHSYQSRGGGGGGGGLKQVKATISSIKY